MKQLKTYYFFYKKILIPSFLVSLVVAFLVGFSVENLMLAYLFFAPFFHYFIYEVRNNNEYYFYANFGLSRIFLWKITLSISIILEFLIWIF